MGGALWFTAIFIMVTQERDRMRNRSTWWQWPNSKQLYLSFIESTAVPKRTVALGIYAFVATADTVAVAAVVLLITHCRLHQSTIFPMWFLPMCFLCLRLAALSFDAISSSDGICRWICWWRTHHKQKKVLLRHQQSILQSSMSEEFVMHVQELQSWSSFFGCKRHYFVSNFSVKKRLR